MVYLERKRIGGNSYYYASVNARVDGKPRRARTVYLGTAEEILRVVQEHKSGVPLADAEQRARVKAFPFGPIAALLRTARDLHFVETIDHYAPKRTTPGFSVGQYALLTILARVVEPWSKAATGRWFYRKSFLRFVWDAPHQLNSQNILSNLDRLADLSVQRRVEEAFTRLLVERGLRPSQIFWDGTNWSTTIEKGEELPHPGKAKDRRYDLNLIGMAFAMAEDFTPLMHEVAPGNFDESEVFGRMVEALALRLERVHLDPSEMVLVMDKGPNSEENLRKVTDWMHVVGAVPANLVPDLMDLELERFSPLHATGRGHPLLAYRARRELYGIESTVVVTYNSATAHRKADTLARCERRFLAGMEKLKAGYERVKGRQVSYPRAAAIAAALVPAEYQAVFRYELVPNPKSLRYEVREESKATLLRHFGRRVFFSDLELDPEEIVRRYRGAVQSGRADPLDEGRRADAARAAVCAEGSVDPGARLPRGDGTDAMATDVEADPRGRDHRRGARSGRGTRRARPGAGEPPAAGRTEGRELGDRRARSSGGATLGDARTREGNPAVKGPKHPF